MRVLKKKKKERENQKGGEEDFGPGFQGDFRMKHSRDVADFHGENVIGGHI